MARGLEICFSSCHAQDFRIKENREAFLKRWEELTGECWEAFFDSDGRFTARPVKSDGGKNEEKRTGRD